jgi:hypothetical protein
MTVYGVPLPYPGGVLTALDAERIHARADNGRSYILHRLGHVNAMWRNAENWLLLRAGLPLKPKCCSTCGAEVVERKDCYCNNACREGRKGRLSPAEVAYDSLTPAMIRASLDASLARRPKSKQEGADAEGGATQTPQGRTKRAYFSFTPVCDFKAALALADALIVAKGGVVPVRAPSWTYAQVAEAHQAALARREQRYERSKTA